jgi:acyl-CoA synthetase (AMP-forming)/AMP-acid ligase II
MPSALFFELLERWGTATALISPNGEAISYASLLESADAFSSAIGPERRIVFLKMNNSVDSITAYIGCLRAHHPVFPFSPDDDHAKIARLADVFEANCIVDATSGSWTVEWRTRDVHDLHPDLSLLLSTSGSTGTQKMVKLSGLNISSNANSIAEYLGLSQRDRAITTLSPNYSYGLSVINSHLAVGASLVLTNVSVLDEAFVPLITAHEVTSFAGVPHTFELLKRAGIDFSGLPSLRYVTQAGGKLPPDMASELGKLAAKHGFEFFVMYGQTEAAPRIAYLPPEHLLAYPSCIGVPIPGGTITLVSDTGDEITEPDLAGELVYSGPNVMMGYALSAGELATDERPGRLHTGDIAARNSVGLLYVVGRKARFVKPFGVRVSLDDLEGMAREFEPSAVCLGNDERIVIASSAPFPDAGVEAIASRCNLPLRIIDRALLDEIPRLPNGKVDYKSLSQLTLPAERSATDPGSMAGKILLPLRIATDPAFYTDFLQELGSAFGFGRSAKLDVAEAFRSTLNVQALQPDDSFVSLGGDSLRYVELSLALEEIFGELPPGWERMPVEQLEDLRVSASL